jgi:hypothetical protein
MLALLMMLMGAPAAEAPAKPPAAADRPKTVDELVITGRGKDKEAPGWSWSLSGKGWPMLGVAADNGVVLFAKTAPRPAGSTYEQVWVRHEFHEPQKDTDAVGAPTGPLKPYLSERIVEQVDCANRAYRTLMAYRFPKNNLEGVGEAFDYADKAWIKPQPDTFDETVVVSACTYPQDVLGAPTTGS